MTTQKIRTFLWFDDCAEEAIRLYLDVFGDGRIGETLRAPEGTPRPAGSVLTAEFELFGRQFVALNGGPGYPFTEAISLTVECDTQEEVDRYWNGLTTDGGAPSACGWLKDRFGLSWQIVPKRLPELLRDADPERARRALAAMMRMSKLEIAALEAAADGR